MIDAKAVTTRSLVRPLCALVLGSAMTIPVNAQQAATQPGAAPSPSTLSSQPAREGFWGRVNPFARKKWVNQRVVPLEDRLRELDEVNARNAASIQDVDARAQAGIARAQTAAEAASEQARAAGASAEQASGVAQGAAKRTDQIGQTVAGLDQYKSAREVELSFRGGNAELTLAARQQLDELSTGLKGRKGYVVEIEGHARGLGNLGLQNSERMNETVTRYLVANGQLPLYRVHAVALGQPRPEKGSKPAPSTVCVRVLENSLAGR